MTTVHVITLPEQSGRETSLDKLCRLTAILLACEQRMRDARKEAA